MLATLAIWMNRPATLGDLALFILLDLALAGLITSLRRLR
jgi:hypothetical protein